MIHRSPHPDLLIPECTLTELMFETAARRPDHPAFVDGVSGTAITYREWADKVCNTKCKDEACFQSIRDEAKGMAAKAERTRGTQAQEDQVVAEVERARECLVEMIRTQGHRE